MPYNNIATIQLLELIWFLLRSHLKIPLLSTYCMISFKIDSRPIYVLYANGNQKSCHLWEIEIDCKGRGRNSLGWWECSISSLVTWMYTFVKTYWIIYRRYMHFTLFYTINFILLKCEKLLCITLILTHQRISWVSSSPCYVFLIALSIYKTLENFLFFISIWNNWIGCSIFSLVLYSV